VHSDCCFPAPCTNILTYLLTYSIILTCSQIKRLDYLEEQYERHPLVVADELSVLGDVEPLLGNRLFDR